MFIQSPLGKPGREQTALRSDGGYEAGGSPSFMDPNLLESPENSSQVPADSLSPRRRKVVGLCSNSWELGFDFNPGEQAESAPEISILSIREYATT